MIYEVFNLDQNEDLYESEEKIQKKLVESAQNSNEEGVEEAQGKPIAQGGPEESEVYQRKPRKDKYERKPYKYEEMMNNRSSHISKIQETPGDSTKG